MNQRIMFLVVAATILVSTTVFVSAQVLKTEALVPSIVSVTSYVVGSTRWVNVTVNHTPPPAIGASHYVSNIQLEINGTAQDLAQSPQTTETFSVQYSLGANSNTYSVRARALCIVHGYSSFSGTVTVPEFPPFAAMVFLLLAAIAVVVFRKSLGSRTKVRWLD